MNVADFDYELPPERIAQHPLPRRDASRLLVLERSSGTTAHRRFRDLTRLLVPGDLLVLNDTRVIPARLIGRKSTGGRVELLLLERQDRIWRCLVQASRKPAVGSTLAFDGGLAGRILERFGEEWSVDLTHGSGDVERELERVGAMPLPPYIKRDAGKPPPVDDRERYQTVFAERAGAVAAPTAGLHFTPELLQALRESGVELAFLTLHVGPGTFVPVRSERVEEHRMQAERFVLSQAVAGAVERTRGRGGRVVAVGTTVVRTLESRADDSGRVIAGSGRAELFIYPGYRFRVVDAMLTNFHLPRSTLLMLVSAFAGRERILSAYREAVRRGYRFYSYGDAMLLR